MATADAASGAVVILAEAAATAEAVVSGRSVSIGSTADSSCALLSYTEHLKWCPLH